eukprot:628169-Lingulodinium_polyedra.AAC.1
MQATQHASNRTYKWSCLHACWTTSTSRSPGGTHEATMTTEAPKPFCCTSFLLGIFLYLCW